MKRTIALAAMVASLGSVALAGPQYVDESGYAASGYDVVAFWSLSQNAVGQAQPNAIPGNASFTHDWNGATWAFSTPENRDLFASAPERYAPQFDGHCAYGIAQGGKVPANPNLWRIVDDKLYLNITPNVVGFWEEDIPGQITAAYENWKGLEVKPASERLWTAINANDGTYAGPAPVTN
ncbi:MAG: YHS domain-containing (seleno)protein [Pseudomonadota bacterium]